VPLLAAKTILIRAKVTGTLGIRRVVKGLIGREVKGVKIKVKVVEVEAIRAKTNYVRTLKFRKITLKISY
jgi:hypothetical protein